MNQKTRTSEEICPENVICSEHLYIDIISKDGAYFIRGFISNFLESDLYNIRDNCSSNSGVFEHCEIKYITLKNSSKEYIRDYLSSALGFYWHFFLSTNIRECYGVELFEKNIYLDTSNKTFAIDLSNVKLKDEFDQLIKTNVDKIKKILFLNKIPNDPKYSTY